MRIYEWISRQVKGHPWAIVAASLVITVVLGIGLIFMKGQLKYESMLPGDFPSVKSIKSLAKNFDGISYETVLLVAPNNGKVTDNRVVQFLIGLEDFLNQDPRFNQGQVVTTPGQQGNVPQILKQPVPIVQDYMTPFIANIKQVLAQNGFSIKLSSITNALIRSQTGKDFQQTVEQDFLSDPQAHASLVGMQKFITPDYKVAVMQIKTNPTLSDTQSAKVGNDLENLFREKLTTPKLPSGAPNPLYVPGLKVYFSGDATLARDFDRHIKNKTILLFILSIVFVILALFLAFRRTSDTVWPIVTMIMSLVWTFGLMGYLGIPYSVASVALMPLLLGHALTFVVPFVARYYEESGDAPHAWASLRATLTTVGVALFPAAATSVAGFLVFEFSVIPALRDFGLAAAIGTIFLFVLAITLLPALMLLRDRRIERATSVEERAKLKVHFDGFTRRQQHSLFARGTDRVLDWFGTISTTHSLIVIGLGTVLIVGGLATSFGLTTDSDLRKLVPHDLPTIKSDFLVEKYFGPDQTDVIMIDGDVTSPTAIAKMAELEKAIYNDPRNTFTVYDKQTGKSVTHHHYDQNAITGLVQVVAPPDWSVASGSTGQLPQDAQQVQAAIKTANDNGGYVGGVLSADNKHALISLNGLAASTAEIVNTKEAILRESAQRVLKGSGLSFELGGITPLTKDLTKNIIPTETWSSVLSLVLCGLLLMLIFRSVPYGAITLVVAFAGVAAELAFLTLLRYPIDVVTSLSSAIVIGVGSNFGILFTHRFMQTMQKGTVSPVEAIRNTMKNLGRANVVAALSTVVGFIIIMFSQIQPIKRFGGVSAFGIAISVIASLTIMPALLYRFSMHKQTEMEDKAALEEAPAAGPAA